MIGAPVSSAQEVRLNLHGPSWHINSQNDNGWTFGAGGEIARRAKAWRYGGLLGAYYNSVWSPSLYVGLAGSYEITDWIGIGLSVTAATGYDREVCYDTTLGRQSCFRLEWARPITLIPLPFVSVGNRVKLRIAGSSSLESSVLHLMLSLPLR